MNFSDEKKNKKNQEERIHCTKKEMKNKIESTKKDNVSFSKYFLVLSYF